MRHRIQYWITNNGEIDLMVMSHEVFCHREAWFRLQSKLAEAARQIAAGQLIDHEVFERLQEYTIRYTEISIEDLDLIFDYISADNSNAALKMRLNG